ncbi:DMT family transporter [Rubrimonas cliftonensis]|uniref:EamA-like transporter family protein n=1 Tax=Rubrimonas cliftonensis TaxID=89524 RepID=A0A1H4EDT5_9RHOB|nr:DMT family transporter [Rubrimonas cliftonensis]SEA82432.1 EamA-like transporter family protein [Rubrimonas cliftonensis]
MAPMRPASPRLAGPALGYAAAAFAVLVWAGWIVLTRAGAAASALTPLDVAALRYAGPALALAPVWLRRGPVPAGVARWRLMGMTLGWGAPFALFAAKGLESADAALFAALAPGAMPLWAALLAAMFFGARFSRLAVAGLAMIGGAVALALWAAAPQTLAGAPWVTAAAIGWAVYTLSYRGSGLTPVEATAIVGFWSSLLVALLALGGAMGGLTLHMLPPPEALGWFAAHGLVSGVLSVAAYAVAIRELGATRAAGSAALVPALATLMGWLFLGEAPGAGPLAAVALATLGVTLVSVAPARPRG